ncbi:hypothetical protein E4U55_006324 [Claviceps digitariae]|nr:hypothetical protein E4U55_006324 [Claviceps digitariae]
MFDGVRSLGGFVVCVLYGYSFYIPVAVSLESSYYKWDSGNLTEKNNLGLHTEPLPVTLST